MSTHTAVRTCEDRARYITPNRVMLLLLTAVCDTFDLYLRVRSNATQTRRPVTTASMTVNLAYGYYRDNNIVVRGT